MIIIFGVICQISLRVIQCVKHDKSGLYGQKNFACFITVWYNKEVQNYTIVQYRYYIKVSVLNTPINIRHGLIRSFMKPQ